MVTNAAITTMYEGIRTWSGMRFFSAEITVLVHTKTAAVASPILIPLIADVVVASVGHIPNISTKVGFSLINPLKKCFKTFIILPPLF